MPGRNRRRRQLTYDASWAFRRRLRASIFFLSGRDEQFAARCGGGLRAGDVRTLVVFVLFECLLQVFGVVTQGLGQEPGSGQRQAGSASGQIGGAMCGVTDQHDAALMPAGILIWLTESK